MKTDKTYIMEKRGFTLIEVLLTVTIFAVIITTLFSSFRFFITSTHAMKRGVVRIEKTTTVFNQLSLDIQMIFITQPPRYKKPQFDLEPDLYRFEGDSNELSFATLCNVKHQDDISGGVVRVIYYLRPGKIPDTFDLCRRQLVFPYEDPGESCLDPVLVSNVSAIEFAYIDKNGEYLNYWDSESKEFQFTLPSAVNIKIKLLAAGDVDPSGMLPVATIESSLSIHTNRFFSE